MTNHFPDDYAGVSDFNQQPEPKMPAVPIPKVPIPRNFRRKAKPINGYVLLGLVLLSTICSILVASLIFALMGHPIPTILIPHSSIPLLSMGWLSNPYKTTRKIRRPVDGVPQPLPHGRKGHAERMFERFVLLCIGVALMLLLFLWIAQTWKVTP